LACFLLGQIVGLRRDRGEELRKREVLNQQAFTDPLTGLSNRRAYDAEVSRRIQGLSRGLPNLCLVLIDLDHFKHVNDSLGHTAGDQFLKQAGTALASSVRNQDLVARFGGDEFVVLISNLAEETALLVVERIRASIGTLEERTTASAGFCIVARPIDPVVLFEAADQALMKAKAEGRNRTLRSSCQ